jgi:hypothetical protein
MLFLSALVFAVVMYLLPGELLLVSFVAQATSSPLEFHLALTLGNAAVFALICAAVRFTRISVFDLGRERGGFSSRLAEYLDVSGWRWLNLLGLVGIGSGAALLAIDGQIPFPFWFLFAAIVAGFADILKAPRVVPLPKDPPAPRYVPAPVPETPERPEGKTVQFTWEHFFPGEANRSLRRSQEFTLGQAEYDAARGLERFPRRPIKEYTRYVREGVSPSVQQVAEYFRNETVRERQSPVEEVMNVVGFARGIVYVDDEQSRGSSDYANFPIETLYDQGGDCEDHAILAAALLYSLGHDVGLFHLELGDSGHLALGYRPLVSGMVPPGPFSETADNGREYYYVETVPTHSSDGLGKISEQFLRELEKQSVVTVV